MSETRTPQSDNVLASGERLLEPYTRLRQARAALIMGSTAEGTSDYFSDLDMTVYYRPLENVLDSRPCGFPKTRKVFGKAVQNII